jgi:hypothetical protein
MRDYIGNMDIYQKQLDDAGIKWDVTFLCGLALPEIVDRIAKIIADYQSGVDVYGYLPQD